MGSTVSAPAPAPAPAPAQIDALISELVAKETELIAKLAAQRTDIVLHNKLLEKLVENEKLTEKNEELLLNGAKLTEILNAYKKICKMVQNNEPLVDIRNEIFEVRLLESDDPSVLFPKNEGHTGWHGLPDGWQSNESCSACVRN